MISTHCGCYSNLGGAGSFVILFYLVALILPAQTIATSVGATGKSLRLGFDVDSPVRKSCLAFERGWIYPSAGGYGSRLAVGCRVLPHVSLAPGVVITGPRFRASPAIGLTFPLTGRLLVFGNRLLRSGTDIGMEYLLPWDKFKMKLSADCFRAGGTVSCSLHLGLLWRRL